MNRVYSLNTPLHWKRYEGELLKDVIDKDLGYIKFLHRTRLITWDADAWEYFMDAAGKDTHRKRPLVNRAYVSKKSARKK